MINMRKMDLNLLLSLQVLLEECNVTRAAQRLHLGQSALSSQLARLREMFGDPLLLASDTGRGMVPTVRALALLPELRKLLVQIEAVVSAAPGFDPMQAERDFRIAASDNAATTLGAALMAKLPALAGPGVRLAFVPADAQLIAGQLERGEVDLLIGSERMLPHTMKARKLVDEHFVLVQRKGHPRGDRKPTLKAYCALEHVLVSTSGGSFHGYMDEQLARQGKARRVALSVSSFLLAAQLVSESDYVATLPSRLAARHGDRLDSFPLPFEAGGFSLSAGWHPRYHADPASIWLRQALLSVASAGANAASDRG